MDNKEQIKALASKLLQQGVTRSHMDAMKMAESMITTDMKPSGKKIDNIPQEKPVPQKAPVQQPTETDAPLGHIETGADVNSMTVNEASAQEGSDRKSTRLNSSHYS